MNDQERQGPPGSKRFKVHLFLAKAYEDKTGDWWLEGVASGTKVDLQGERMAKECVEAMKAQINGGAIPLRSSHYSDWDEEIGVIKSGDVNPGGELIVKVWLDKAHEKAQTLWRKMNGVPGKVDPAKLGMSIGGYLLNATEELIDGTLTRVIRALELDHICVTSRPAYPDAWITGASEKALEFRRPWMRDITKSWDWRQAAPADGIVAQADPEAGDVPAGSEEGGDPVLKIENAPVTKDDAAESPPPAPPEASKAEDQAPEQEDKQPAGVWMKLNACKGEEEVWVKAVAPAPDGQPPQQQPPPAEGKADAETREEKEMTDDLKVLKAQIEQLQAQLATREGGVRRGVRDQEADLEVEAARKSEDGRTQVSAIEVLKASDAYRNAEHLERIRMLRDAYSSAMRNGSR